MADLQESQVVDVGDESLEDATLPMESIESQWRLGEPESSSPLPASSAYALGPERSPPESTPEDEDKKNLGVLIRMVMKKQDALKMLGISQPFNFQYVIMPIFAFFPSGD